MLFEKNLSNEEFNPEIIINSGQVFRMQREATEGDKVVYSAFSGKNEIYFSYNPAGEYWEFNCHENQWGFWQEYFDFSTDYCVYNKVIKESSDLYLHNCLKDAFGMRILKQDLWETVVTYIISQNNNIPRIKKSINRLCDYYSDGLIFPSAEVLADISVEELMNTISLGYRASYIKSLATGVVEQKIDLNRCFNFNRQDAYDYLLKIKGVGPKVANCILLYGYHFMESYPIDTWMKRIIAEDYKDYNSSNYLDYINSTFGGFQGYIQQIQFYHKRLENKKISRF